MLISSEKLYEELIKEGVLTNKGSIHFNFGTVDIVVKHRDVVGNIIQEWVEGWLNQHNVEFDTNPNTQMPPDFFLNPENKKENLLEVKAFNRNASPAFDIADFRAYTEELIKQPWMLYANYLIFGYSMENGYVVVKDLWNKKVWEIVSASKNWPLKLQVKGKVVHKIRPAHWYSDSAKYKVFKSLEHFLSAVEETAFRDPKTHDSAGTWRAEFQDSFFKNYHKEIKIPRWEEISKLYQPKK